MPDHHSNKTCRRWDSFQYPRILEYAGIENHVQKYILKQRVTFFCLLRKGKTIVLALPLALHMGPYHAAAVTKFDWQHYNTWLSDLSANRIVFPRTGDWTDVMFRISGNMGQKRTFDTLHQQSKVKLTRRILTLTPTSL